MGVTGVTGGGLVAGGSRPSLGAPPIGIVVIGGEVAAALSRSMASLSCLMCPSMSGRTSFLLV